MGRADSGPGMVLAPMDPSLDRIYSEAQNPKLTQIPSNEGVLLQSPGLDDFKSDSQPLQQLQQQDAPVPDNVKTVDIRDFDFLNYLSNLTGLPRLYVAVGLIAGFWLVVILTLGFRTFINFVAFSYPAYMTFKTLENNEMDHHINWLMYWIVYSIFSFFEFMADRLLAWLPYYSPFKIAFLLWCFLPQSQGAIKIYSFLVRPFLKQNEEAIERSFDKLQDTTIQATGEIRDMFSESLVASSLRLFAKLFTTYLFPFIFRKAKTTEVQTPGPHPPPYPPPPTAQGPSPPPYPPPVRQK